MMTAQTTPVIESSSAGAPEKLYLGGTKPIPQCPNNHPDSILVNDQHCIMCGFHFWTDEDRAALAAVRDAQHHEVKRGSELHFKYARKVRIGLVIRIDFSKEDPVITMIFDMNGDPRSTMKKASEVWI